MPSKSRKSRTTFNSIAAYFSEFVWSRYPKLFYSTFPSTLPYYPRGVQLEITTKCNLNCIMCPNRGFKGFKMADMKMDTFLKALDQSLPEIEYIYLWGVGEPLTNPNFLEMIKIAKSIGLKVSFSTNGTFMNEKMAKSLVDLKVDDIIFSVDSANPETFEKIRKWAKFETVIGNLENLLRIKRERNSKQPNVSMTCSIMKTNLSEMPGLVELAHKLGIPKVWFQNIISWNKFTQEQSLLSIKNSKQVKNAFKKTKKLADEKGVQIRLPEMEVGDGSLCRFPWFGPMNVRWDGSVTLCPWIAYPTEMFYVLEKGKVGKRHVDFAPWIVGNINETPLKEIWNNEKYRLMRDLYKKHRQPYPCNLCLHQYQVIC